MGCQGSEARSEVVVMIKLRGAWYSVTLEQIQ